MNIYTITRREPSDQYDIYDGAVVYAKDAKSARNMHPGDGKPIAPRHPTDLSLDTWVTDSSEVAVKMIGTAPNRKRPGVIMTDFKAG